MSSWGFTRTQHRAVAGPEDRFVRFGSFEADLREGKLTKTGARIRLQEQPFRILALLLEYPGQLVTREEIRQKLWSNDTFVEFDAALNTAVRKLRGALNDSADNPRFLATVPRRGYRFIAPGNLTARTASCAVDDVPPPSTPVSLARRHTDRGRRSRRIVPATSPSTSPDHSQRHDRSSRFCQRHGRRDPRRHAEDGAQRFPATIAFPESAP